MFCISGSGSVNDNIMIITPGGGQKRRQSILRTAIRAAGATRQPCHSNIHHLARLDREMTSAGRHPRRKRLEGRQTVRQTSKKKGRTQIISLNHHLVTGNLNTALQLCHSNPQYLSWSKIFGQAVMTREKVNKKAVRDVSGRMSDVSQVIKLSHANTPNICQSGLARIND